MTNAPDHKKRLINNIASLYLLQGLNYLIPMLVLPYLVRILGMETYGLVAFSQSFAQYFVLFTDYGFNFTATRAIAQNREDHQVVRAIFWQVMIIKIVLLLAGLLLLLAIVALVPRLRHDMLFFLVAYITVLGNVLFPQWYFQGVEKMRYISLFTGVAKLLSAAVLFLVVRTPSDGLLAVGILSAGMLIAGVMGLYTALREIGLKIVWPNQQQLRTMLSEGSHMFLATASISLYTNTNVFLVGLLAGNVQAGYFSAADKLIRAIVGMIFPVLQAAFPHISRLVQESRQKALNFYRRTVLIGSVIGGAVSILIFLFAPYIARLAFGSRSVGVTPVLQSIAAFPVVSVVTASMCMLIYAPFGLEKIYSRLLLFVGVVNVLVACSLIPLMGALGAAIGMVLVETFQLIAGWWVLHRQGIHLLDTAKNQA